MNRTKVITALNLNTTEEQILVQGWVKNYRKGKSISFISINDGSTIKNIQIVVENSKFDIAATITPHHLHINRNAMFHGGLRSDFYCLPTIRT